MHRPCRSRRCREPPLRANPIRMMSENIRFDLAGWLARLGIGNVHPDADGLRALQHAHILSVPFENFDPLLGRVPLLGVPEIFDKVVTRRRGGFCFELNGLYEAALAELGFSVRRLLARVRMRFGPEGARSHLILRVDVGGQSFLTDVGFGGPGPLVPLELGLSGVQEAPNGAFRITEDLERGETVLERLTDDGWEDLYAFDGARVTDFEIAAANHFCSTWDATPFGSHLVLNCFENGRRYGLFDRAISITGSGAEERREIADFDEFTGFVCGKARLSLSDEALARAWEKIS